MLKLSESKQEKLEKELEEVWKQAVVELEKSVTQAQTERDTLSNKLAELREQVQNKKNFNEATIAQNKEQEFEVERITDFAKQL